MIDPDYEIALGTAADVGGIVALQDRNLRSNGGALSVRFSPDWFAKAITDMPLIVARHAGDIVGYVVSTPLTAQAHDPVIQAMLAAYCGSAGAYNYGPICVAEEHRGRGLALAMFGQLRARLVGREGLTFIRADNTLSLKVHARMGMHEVAKFSHEGDAYVVVAYQG